MLRSLNPDNGYQPKTKAFIPTEEERKLLSENEVEYIDRTKADDDRLTIQRLIKRRQEDLIREDLARAASGDAPTSGALQDHNGGNGGNSGKGKK